MLDTLANSYLVVEIFKTKNLEKYLSPLVNFSWGWGWFSAVVEYVLVPFYFVLSIPQVWFLSKRDLVYSHSL